MMKKLIGIVLGLFFTVSTFAQPGNDNWKNAYEIVIPEGGYATGTFAGQKSTFKDATIENRESFIRPLKLVALNKKTVWYKFTTKQWQTVTLAIRQNDTIIHPQDLGLIVYNSTTSFPEKTDQSYYFSALTRVGESTTQCLPPGEYFIQFCARKNVEDSAWIELTTTSSKWQGNLIGNPRLASIDMDRWDFSSSCFSLESPKEAEPFDTSIFKRSVYLEYTTPNNLGELNYEFEGYGFSYQFFEGDHLDSSTWVLIDSFSHVSNKKSVTNTFKSICDGVIKSNTQYFFKILLHFTSNIEFSGIESKILQPNKGSNPDASLFSFGIIDNKKNVAFIDKVVCGVDGTEFLCSDYKDLLWDTVSYTYDNEPIIDTMNFGSWFTFEVTRPLQIAFNYNSSGYERFRDLPRQKQWLFNGEYGKPGFCDLVPIEINSNNNRMCLTEGVYTIFIGMYRNYLTPRDSTYMGFLGADVNVGLNIYKNDPIQTDSAKFDDPLKPKHYSDILDGSATTYEQELEKDWIYGPYRDIEIDGIRNYGHFSFYTFELEKDAYVYIWHNTNQASYYWRVYSGNCANGLSDLETYQNVGYKDQPTQQLQKLKKGIYTILAIRSKSDICNPPRLHQTQMIFKATTEETPEPDPCKPKYQFAKTAAKINAGQPLVCNEAAKSTKFTQYDFPVTCLNKVNNRGNQHWYNLGTNSGHSDRFVYFEFEIKEKCNFRIQCSEYYQLLKGSISNDSSIVENGSNVIVENSTYNYSHCALEASKYTVIIRGDEYIPNYWARIDIGHFFKNEHDHATNAYDFGVLSIDNPFFSNTSEFNCKTSAQKFDPTYHKNTWYTFRVAGRGQVTVNIKDGEVRVLKATRGHNLSFAQIKASNQIDSVPYQNLEDVNAAGTRNESKFYKFGTDTVRYYFQVRHYDDVGEIYNFISFLYDKNATTSGDYCSNAISGSIDGLGKYKGDVWTAIHTIGEAPNEQFNAQLNRPYLEMEDLKTTWFKVELKNVSGSKLVVKNQNSNADEIKVYAGNCSSMTLIGATLGNNTISLDCIEDGEYMFQLYSPKDHEGYVFLEIETKPALGICPVVNPTKLIANFDYSNGCKGDTIQLINLSSSGSDLSYKWDFGNGDTSNKTHPIIRYGQKDPDSVKVVLWVYNNKTNQKDSTSEWLYLALPNMGLITDTAICGSEVELEIKNYQPKKYRYAWHRLNSFILIDGERVLNTESKKRRFTPYLYGDTLNLVLASVAIKNCINYDTVKVRSLQLGLIKMGQERYSYKCFNESDTLKIKRLPYATRVSWENGDTSHTRIVNETGHYRYSIFLPYCSHKDSILVNEYVKPIYTLDTNLCKNDLVINNIEIRSFTDFYVAAINGQEARNYQLNDSFIRLHWVNRDSSCFYTDTIPAPISGIWNFKNQEAELCEGDTIKLIAPNSPFSYTWNTGDKKDTLSVSNETSYRLTARLNGCEYTLNYLVNETIGPKPINDTTVCNFDPPLLFEVNDTFNVLWSTGENANSISLNDSGHYWFVAKTENCEFSDSFQVIRDCPPQLYIPNAFTPGTDHLNPTFIAKGTEIENYEMRIYAQNGQRVFYTNELNEGWDGTVRFEPAQIGTYYYVITYTLKGESRVESGNLSLLR